MSIFQTARLVRCFGIILSACLILSSTPSPSFAKTERTAWGHIWAKCKSRKKPVHMVWIPGLFPQCLWGYPLDAKTKARSLKLCEKFAPRVIRGKFRCVVAARNGRIVDKRLARAVRSSPAVPVRITIFDKKTGRTQKTNGTLRERKTTTLKRVPMDIYAGSAKICTGSYSAGLGASATFKGSCFGEKFSGRAKLSKTQRTSIGYTITPQVIKLKSKGSFIEIRF